MPRLNTPCGTSTHKVNLSSLFCSGLFFKLWTMLRYKMSFQDNKTRTINCSSEYWTPSISFLFITVDVKCSLLCASSTSSAWSTSTGWVRRIVGIHLVGAIVRARLVGGTVWIHGIGTLVIATLSTAGLLFVHFVTESPLMLSTDVDNSNLLKIV
jgi:hypothetical protein